MYDISNDQNLRNFKKREILRILIIIFAALTIVLAILNLFFQVHIIFAFLSYIVVLVLSRIRKKTVINKKEDEFSDIRKEMEKVKRKKKR